MKGISEAKHGAVLSLLLLGFCLRRRLSTDLRPPVISPSWGSVLRRTAVDAGEEQKISLILILSLSLSLSHYNTHTVCLFYDKNSRVIATNMGFKEESYESFYYNLFQRRRDNIFIEWVPFHKKECVESILWSNMDLAPSFKPFYFCLISNVQKEKLIHLFHISTPYTFYDCIYKTKVPTSLRIVLYN